MKSLIVAASLLAAAACFAAEPAVHSITLPGANPNGIAMDYIAYDANTHTVWVPGNTGAVDVIDSAGKVRQVTGFPTKEVTVRDRKRVVGPSSISFGGGKAYVGNRADFTICEVDPKALTRGRCSEALSSMPDGVAYVGETKEVWVTAPREKTIHILDAATLHEKAKLAYDGSPEGFAVDAKRHRFYTNLEDKDRTLAIDLTSHKTIATWNPACGEDGPHGLRVDQSTGELFVACSAKVEVLDAAKDGAILSSVDTGDGVDDFDYAPATHMIYVGAARAAKLTIARVDKGKLTTVSTVAVPAGSRNPAVASDGTVYLAHGGGVVSSDIVVVAPR